MKLAIVISTWILLAAAAAATSTRAVRRLGGSYQQDESQIFRITVMVNLWRQENGSFVSHTHKNEPEILAIPIIDGVESNELYAMTLPHDIVNSSHHYAKMQQGNLFITVTRFQKINNTITFTEKSTVSVVNDYSNNRQLARDDDDDDGYNNNGIRKVAILRVSMAKGESTQRQVSYSTKDIEKHIFKSHSSLAQQIYWCSGGQISITSGGVYEVTVPGQVADYPDAAAIRNQALDMFYEKEGVESAGQIAHHFMVILPPNHFENFVANAGVNHWLSTLNDKWALDMTVYMHEIAHNLGLSHAYLSDESPDYSSYMSPTGSEPNLLGPLKCFNAASNLQLGWFQDRTQNIDFSVSPSHLVTLAAFSESHKSVGESYDPVILKVGDLSLQYNYASEFNVGTEILRNQVTVSYATMGTTVVHKDGLEPHGIIFIEENFENSGQTLRMEACHVFPGSRSTPNAMAVAITLGRLGSPCDNVTPLSPTNVPTSSPRSKDAPTSSPSLAHHSSRPVCPDSSKRLVSYYHGKKIKTITCDWLLKRGTKRLIKHCYRSTLASANKYGHPPQVVLDVCQQECASISDLCVPAGV